MVRGRWKGILVRVLPAFLILIVLLAPLAFVQIGSIDASCASAIGADTTPEADRWPTPHHDPAFTGYSPSDSAPATNDTLWTFQTGSGQLTFRPVAVVDGRVYLGSDGTYCLNATDGSLIWRYEAGGSTSPAVDQGKVYIGGDKMYCFDAYNGSLIWSHDSPAYTPTVADDMVYFAVRGRYPSQVRCLDGADGRMVWNAIVAQESVDFANNPFPSGPSVAGGRLYIGIDGNLTCLDASTGALLWKFRNSWGNRPRGSPAIVDGRVYAGFEYFVHCIDAASGKWIWNYSRPYPARFSIPAVAYGRIYLGSVDGTFTCLDPATGAEVWLHAGVFSGQDVADEPAVADHKVYVGSYGHHMVYCLDSENGRLIWSYKPVDKTQTFSSPAVAQGRVYVGSSDGKVYCFGMRDRVDGTVYDIWTNIPQAAHIREPPMPGITVQLFTRPDRTLVAESTTQADGTYTIRPKELDPDQPYLVRVATQVNDKEIVQQRNITGGQHVDFYLPVSLVKDYLRLVGELDSIELPSLSDVDLMLGLGFGGPLHQASLYGPLAELANLGFAINESQSLQTRLENHLDQILADAPLCRSLLKGEATSDDPWNKLLRVTLVLGFIRNRVDDAYISIDNVVKATTVAVMTGLMMDAMRATSKTKLPTVDKLTSKPVRWAQEKLLKGGDETMKRIASTLHITLFAGGFGLGGVDWLLEKAGITDPATKTAWKTVMAKGIRAISDLVRKNFGTSLIFEVLFQGARTIGDTALLEFYLWLTRGEIENALWAANNSQTINKPLEAVNAISVMDTEHEDWHKIQHSWAVSWFKAANVFRGVGGIWGVWTAPTGIEYPFIWEAATPLIKKLRAANVWLTVAGIGSFAGVIITELRALYVTWSKQLDAVYESFGGESPLAGESGLGSPAGESGNPSSQASSLQAAPALDAYLATLNKLGVSVQAGDKEAAAAAVLELEEPDGPLATQLESMFLKLSAAYPKALFETEGFDATHMQAIDAYTSALIEQADLYASTAMWLRDEPIDAGEIAHGIESTSQTLTDAWNALYGAVGSIAGLTVPGFLFLSPNIPETIALDDEAEVSVVVRNVGDETVRDVNITLWVSDALIISADPTIDLGEIAPGATAQATWKVSIGAGKPGDIATFWFTAQGDGTETMEESGASLLTLGETSQLEIVANSPVRMMVSDSLGHRVGLDPETGGEVNEITGATYSGLESSPQRVTIPDPFGNYRVDLLGTDNGPYHLEIKAFQDGTQVGAQTSEGLASADQWSTHQTSVNQANGTLLLFNPEEALKAAVYYDVRYPTVWISPEEAAAYRDYLRGQGFIELDADQVKAFMEENGPDSIVVMAQDAAPDTVADVMGAKSIIRMYMDRGGTVIWMQDIPFYWQGHADGTRTQWGTEGMSSILGVYMGAWDTGDVVEITADGAARGLTRTWNASRPVDPVLSGIARTYAYSQGGAASWLKNFCPTLPESGFIRMWDDMGDFSAIGYVADLVQVARTVHPIDELSRFMGSLALLAGACLPFVIGGRHRSDRKRIFPCPAVERPRLNQP